MTELESFECPQCGAKVDRPAPGTTTRCKFCDGELHAKEPAVREVVREVREVRHEVVREVVVTENEARWARMSPEERARRQKIAWIVFAVGMLAIVVTFFVVKQNADDDFKKFEDEQARRDQCRKDCEQKCEAAPPTHSAPSIDTTPIPGDPEWSSQQMQKLNEDMAKTMHDGDVAMCKAQCQCD